MVGGILTCRRSGEDAAIAAANHRKICGDCTHNHRMHSGDNLYIWQASDWPQWRFDLTPLAAPLAAVSHAQGLLLGRLADVGMALRDQASLGALTMAMAA